MEGTDAYHRAAKVGRDLAGRGAGPRALTESTGFYRARSGPVLDAGRASLPPPN